MPTAYWVDVIRSDLNKTVEGIVAAGKHLTEAKATIGHGEWLPMLDVLELSPQYAQKFMKIGKCLDIEVFDVSTLPRSPEALYALCRMPPAELEARIQDGTVSPQTTVKAAVAIANETVPPRSSAHKPQPPAPTADAHETRGYAKAIQALSWELAETSGELADRELDAALGAAQFLYDLLRGELTIRKEKKHG